MRINSVEFIKLLPAFMRDDPAIQGISEGTDLVIKKLGVTIKTMTTWDSIDSLTEEELDALAEEMNIEWYRRNASISIKRELIRDADTMHKRLGTKWAVERIINTYFGDGYIKEWFEYSGQPGHFKVFSSNPTITDENLQEFISILNKVKRASSHLDGITISLSGQMELAAGVAFHYSGFDTVRLGGRT